MIICNVLFFFLDGLVKMLKPVKSWLVISKNGDIILFNAVNIYWSDPSHIKNIDRGRTVL